MAALSALFISHSSADNEEASQVGEWLRSAGYDDRFLDFDSVDGIPAGKGWEREIYQRIRRADGVVFLSSAASVASKWCFAELAIARLLSKPVIEVVLEPGASLSHLRPQQSVAFGGDNPAGRLATGLKAAGFDPADSFTWDPNRSPYPGLHAFDLQDAAVFFGRDDKIDELLDRLSPLSRSAARLVSVVGPSGSGKSSLVRAGVLPRLRQVAERWVVVPPMTPGNKPTRSLARALAAVLPGDRSVPELRDMLTEPGGLSEVVEEVLDTAPGEPNVLLVIDQAEELITRTGEREQKEFLRIIRGGLRDADRLYVVMTLRSEFLSRDPARAGLTENAYTVVLEPLSRARLPEVIAKPAERAGFEFEAGLVERMVDETVGGDALPLLAFTLFDLEKRRGRATRITVADYAAIHGVAGSLRKHATRTRDALAEQGHGHIVLPTLLKLVNIGDSGDVTRRRVSVESLTADERAVLQAFVDARLLVTDQDSAGASTVEVAHEALLRQWEPLTDAIEDARVDLRLRSELDRLAADWEQRGKGGDDEDDYLVRGGRLDDFQQWADRHSAELDELKTAFLLVSKESQQRRVEELERTANSAFTRQLLARAVSLRDTRPDASLLLDATALLIAPPALRDHARFALLSNLARPHHRATVLRHGGAVRGVAFSPDGRTLATSSWDHTVQLWDLATLQMRHRLYGHDGYVYSVAFNGDGTLLASASADGTVLLRDVADVYRSVPLIGHDGEVTAVAFHPRVPVLASASKDSTVRIWDLLERKQLREIRHPGGVADLAFSPTGSMLVTACLDHKVRSWDLDDGDCVAVMDHHADAVYAVAVSPEGSPVASAGPDLRLVLSTLAGESPIVCEDAHAEPINAVAFSPDGSLVATAGRDRAARIWRVEDGVHLDTLLGHTGWVTALAFSPDGQTLATASGDDTARLWSLARTSRSGSDRDVGGDVLALATNSDEPVLLVSGEHCTLRLWEPNTGRVLATRSHANDVSVAAVHPDGPLIAVADPGGVVRVFDLRAGGQIGADIRPNAGAITVLTFSPDATTVAIGTADGTVALWATMSGEQIRAHRLHKEAVCALAFSPDGQLLMTGGEDDQARLWETQTGKLADQLFGHAGYVQAVAFSAVDQTLATGSADHSIRLWRRSSGSDERLSGHTGAVLALAFRQDGKVLASAGADDTVRLWDVATGQPLAELNVGGSGTVCALGFFLGGDQLCAVRVFRNPSSLGPEALLTSWELTTEELLSRTHDVVPRNLSRQEWSELTGTPERYRPIFTEPTDQPKVSLSTAVTENAV